MNIHLVSSKGRASLFSHVKRHANHRLVKVAPGKLDTALAEAPEDSFFYVDAAGFKENQLWKALRRAVRAYPGRVGVFDPDGVLMDPAQAFFHGAVDVLTRSVLDEGVTAERFEEALRFADAPPLADGPELGEAPALLTEPIHPRNEILSGRAWDEVEQGREYTFWLLFAHLDDTTRYTTQTSESYASRVASRFREHLGGEMGRFGGRIWMWKRFGGLLLFPYDGERCMPIIPAFRMYMNRVIANVEHYQLKNPVSYRMALHVGNTLFQDSGETGDVVSEDVNFIFHLGNKHTEGGEMTITETALSFVPQGLQPYFRDDGMYEDRRVYKMRRIVPE
ncbi:MAG: hypothetical protein GVY29_04610 [Spirochaetes bacterium]|jgi:hypothetical protein|nr:hypothetical protein [Spirochaetota bacterium]